MIHSDEDKVLREALAAIKDCRDALVRAVEKSREAGLRVDAELEKLEQEWRDR